MIENCRIRPFEAGDLPRLHEIREAAYVPVFRSFRTLLGEDVAPIALANAEREQGELLDAICSDKSEDEMFVVEHDGEAIAFCAMSLDQKTKVGEVGLNAVHPDWQGKGVGAWMYDWVLDRMRGAGMQIATVGTGGDASHAPARRAYEKAGFGPSLPTVYMYQTLTDRT